jgi:hypothetical protein
MAEPRLYLASVRCEHCSETIGRFRDGKLKITVRSRLLAVREDGVAELTCHMCKRATRLPLTIFHGESAPVPGAALR